MCRGWPCFEVASLFLLYVLALALAGDVARGGVATLRMAACCVAVAGVLYAAKFLVAYVASFSLGIPLAIDDFTPGFSNIRFFNHAQTATLPLLVLLACLSPRRSRVRALALAASAYWWLALYATQARGSLLALAVACVVLAVVAGRAAWPYLKMVAVTAALGVLAYGVLAGTRADAARHPHAGCAVRCDRADRIRSGVRPHDSCGGAPPN